MPRPHPPHRPRSTAKAQPANPAATAPVTWASAGLLLATLWLLLATAPARSAPPAYDAGFERHWHDGRGEVASYDLTYPRYGELRTGTAVAVTVTEPFDAEARMKSDRGGPGSFGVIKLNLAEDFPTGVYDYNLMTSAFVATQPAGVLSAGNVVKLSFSSQEWCGHVWQQAVFRPQDHPNHLVHLHHSYFQAEGDGVQTLPHPQEGFSEDALILWARGLAGPQPAIGQSVTVPLYRSMALQRLHHLPPAWDTATLTRVSPDRATAWVRSDVGERHYAFTLNDQGVLTRLQRSDGYSLTLRGVERRPYWNQHGKRHADQRRGFGLQPRGPGQM